MLFTRNMTDTVVRLAACLTLIVTLAQTGECQTPSPEKERAQIAILKGDSPAEDKALACKLLAVDGSSESVPELAKLLANEQLASWARIALEAIPGQAADEALRKATESLQGRLLVGTINSIGVRRDAAAGALLIARLQDADADVASAAAVALGRIGNAAAAKALQEALPTSRFEVRSAVAEGCVLCAEKYLSAGQADEAVALYDDVRKADVPRPRKLEATRGAILARGQEGVPLLLEQLRASDKAFFKIGLSTAREFPGSEVDKALAAELETADPERAALVVLAMADRKETVLLPAVLKAAAGGPKPVRLSAIGALGKVGNATCLATLLDIAIEPDAELMQTAKAALAELPGESVDQEIVARLPKAQGKMSLALIELVGQRRIDAVAPLVKALDDADKTVRSAALTSLGATVSAKNLNVLVSQVVAPKRAEDAPVAQLALKTAAVRMPDRDACAVELSAALKRSPAPIKTVLLEILSEVSGAEALKTLGAAAKSNDPQLQDDGSRLLGKWNSVDAAPVLLDLAKTGPAAQYRIRALRGYIGLVRKFPMPDQQRAEMCQTALDASTQAAEQKLVLDVLKLHANLETLKVAIKAAEIPALKNDAGEAAKAIAQKVKSEEAQKLLSKAGLDK
jgi:HEAT repeat protein